jgi:exopolysaccharide biosynthesis polyprenyl glycosylphosphotransferase
MKKENEKITGWITLLVDLVSMICAFHLSGYIRGSIIVKGYMAGLYGNILIVLILSSILVSNVSNNKNICKRGYLEELISIIKDQGKLGLILLGYVFIIQEGSYYSRIFFFLFFLFNILITYVARSYMKLILLLTYKTSSSSSKVMLVTLSKNAVGIIRKIRSEYEWNIYVTTIAIMDKNRVGDRIEGIKVIANRDNLLDMAMANVVDEVFIHLPSKYNIELEEIILELEKMGIVVHMNMDIFNNFNVKEKVINEFAGHQVITFSSALFDERKMVVKRLFDVFGALVGCLITILLTIFLAPIIYIESPGPIFFSQIRVGKNGRKFKIYKFRSMYKDAEQRKAELLAQNEMQGFMFKMTDDPRITKVGKFIRKTSLDEFPQFFNVLRGDMSLVGTRPPTVDEFEQYESRHKRRLSLKPGLTGMWQVSGRSDIDNFEDVVKLDLEYIDNWSFKLDLKLTLKTVGVVVLGRGSK